jgi:ribosomal protein S18 acetylase RimI-like enzyme
MTAFSDDDLYRRGMATLVASWAACARGTPGATMLHAFGGVFAGFPREPETASTTTHTWCATSRPVRADALAAMAAAYAAAGVRRFAAWVHEDDAALRRDLERRGYTLDTATRAMGMALGDIRAPRLQLDLGSLEWSEYVQLFGLPSDLLRSGDLSGFRLVVGCDGGQAVTTALTFDHGGDCGIYNVGTLERARRRGLGTAVTALQLHDARARGCETASLQATPMAEGVYAAVGFRDLGRILEYVP